MRGKLIRAGERDQQRRRTPDGRALHCCCICGVLAAWDDGWSYHGSARELDNAEPVAKACSDPCREAMGPKAGKVTAAMKAAAAEREWREPLGEVRRRGYSDAMEEQGRRHRPEPPDGPPEPPWAA